MKKMLVLCGLCLYSMLSAGQSAGSRIWLIARDGNKYDATIQEVKDGRYRVRYENGAEEWLQKSQFHVYPATASSAASYKSGMEVEISWSQSWYKGTILESKNGQYKVHYDGYGANYDEWVGADRLRLPGGQGRNSNPVVAQQPPAQQQPAARKTGAKRVEYKERGFWYKATVLREEGDRYYLRFDGYDSNEDKWVLKKFTRGIGTGEQAAQAAANCTFGPPPGSFTDASPASDALFKRELYDYYRRGVTGGVESPLEVGVTFTSFRRGAAYANTVSNKPGVGATRRHDGAPANTQIYPVKVVYVVCKRYNDGNTQETIEADFSFFKNRDGEWTCSKDN